LASPAKAWLVAGLTSAFRPGFDPGLPRSGQAPDAREAEPPTVQTPKGFVSGAEELHYIAGITGESDHNTTSEWETIKRPALKQLPKFLAVHCAMYLCK